MIMIMTTAEELRHFVFFLILTLQGRNRRHGWRQLAQMVFIFILIFGCRSCCGKPLHEGNTTSTTAATAHFEWSNSLDHLFVLCFSGIFIDIIVFLTLLILRCDTRR